MKLRKLAKRAVKQGGHKRMITRYYTVLAEEFCEEFTEDNLATMKHFLFECFEDSMNSLEDRYRGDL